MVILLSLDGHFLDFQRICVVLCLDMWPAENSCAHTDRSEWKCLHRFRPGQAESVCTISQRESSPRSTRRVLLKFELIQKLDSFSLRENVFQKFVNEEKWWLKMWQRVSSRTLPFSINLDNWWIKLNELRWNACIIEHYVRHCYIVIIILLYIYEYCIYENEFHMTMTIMFCAIESDYCEATLLSTCHILTKYNTYTFGYSGNKQRCVCVHVAEHVAPRVLNAQHKHSQILVHIHARTLAICAQHGSLFLVEWNENQIGFLESFPINMDECIAWQQQAHQQRLWQQWQQCHIYNIM